MKPQIPPLDTLYKTEKGGIIVLILYMGKPRQKGKFDVPRASQRLCATGRPLEGSSVTFLSIAISFISS
jgi:hypothetical protein